MLEKEELKHQLAVRLTKSDLQNLNVIKKYFGVNAYSEAIRIAIRETVRMLEEASKAK